MKLWPRKSRDTELEQMKRDLYDARMAIATTIAAPNAVRNRFNNDTTGLTATPQGFVGYYIDAAKKVGGF